MYVKIKVDARPRIGKQGQPVAELTKLGQLILSPGEELDTTPMLLTQTSHLDYEELCRLDVLGLVDSPQHDQSQVYLEFQHDQNQVYSELQTLRHKLQRSGIKEEYTQIIEEQKSEGVMETVNQEAQGVEFYIPHKPVVKESAGTTRIRIVYDASAN